MASFQVRDTLCALAKMSCPGKNERTASSDSGVFSTASRAVVVEFAMLGVSDMAVVVGRSTSVVALLRAATGTDVSRVALLAATVALGVVWSAAVASSTAWSCDTAVSSSDVLSFWPHR
jgi:hypothetical protein